MRLSGRRYYSLGLIFFRTAVTFAAGTVAFTTRCTAVTFAARTVAFTTRTTFATRFAFGLYPAFGLGKKCTHRQAVFAGLGVDFDEFYLHLVALFEGRWQPYLRGAPKRFR